MRQIILRAQLLRNVFAKAALEFRQQLCRQRQARCLMVTAVLRQQITLGIYRLVKIKRRNAAAAALGNAIVQADKNRRQVVLVYQARSYDTDNALMPAFGSKHDCRIDMLFLRQLCFRLFHNLTADFLTQCVFTVKLGGNLLRLNAVVGYQKLHRQLRMLQPAHGVQARCQTEADVIGSNACFRTAAGLNQGTQAYQLRCFHSLQATAHQLAVFIDERHNIRYRSQRRQLRQPLPLWQLARLTLLQRLTQLKGNAYAAQMLKRIAAVTLLGVDNCVSGRQNLRHRMVVRNNNIQRLRRIGYLVQTADTAVHRNHQRCTLLRNIF